MKVLIILSVLVAALAFPEGEQYDNKYDNFDVNAVLDNPRLMKSYAECLLGKGSCTPEGATFKKALPDAIATKCDKCTPKQKEILRNVIKAVREKLPNEWEELVQLHDPEGKHREEFAKFLAESD